MAAINFLAFLAAGEFYLGCIDHDDMIAGVQKGGVGGLVLAHQDHSRGAGDPAENLVGGVDNVPLAHDFPFGRN